MGFVVLHYQAIEVTKRCISLVIECAGDINYEIIIVDNASPNKSGEVLQEYYSNQKNVHVILNKTNLGFSKGNNVGYLYAKNNLYCTFIAMLNNDVLLESKDFIKKIYIDYEKYNFGVLGPRIRNRDLKDVNRNPLHEIELNRKAAIQKAKRNRISLYIQYFLSFIYLDGFFVKIKKYFLHKNDRTVQSVMERIEFNVGLHGCFWVFSPLFISNFDGIPEVTYMYWEEWLLYDLCIQNRITSVYDPDIKVFHIGKVSTSQTKKNRNASIRLRYKREIESCKLLIQFARSQI